MVYTLQSSRHPLLALCVITYGALALIAPRDVTSAAPVDQQSDDRHAMSQLPSMWHVERVGDQLRVHHGAGVAKPQLAVLHLNAGYFRIVPDPRSGWGTSFVVPPSFWSLGQLHQGALSTATWAISDQDLTIAITSTRATRTGELTTYAELRLSPPISDTLSVAVAARTSLSDTIVLDERPGEAFKPVMLSSMRVSSRLWDTREAYVGDAAHAIPEDGWLVNPPVVARSFGLLGGTSCWKRNAPTSDVELDAPMGITGWVDGSKTDPNEDNVGMWAASDAILPSWGYRVTARTDRSALCVQLPSALKASSYPLSR